MKKQRSIAVAIHDVEPATFERCALIRDWLYDHGVDRATLLVIPAPDLHPFNDRRPEMAQWLTEVCSSGDAIAQHGLQHRQTQKAGLARQIHARLQGGDAAEFAGLDAEETHRTVQSGRRVLKLAGLEPRGFVAPAYVYTPALRRELDVWFDWWAGLMALHRGNASAAPRRRVNPALTLGTSTGLKRLVSPAGLRLGSLLSGSTLRLDIHPADFAHPRHVLAVEWVLKRAGKRTAITYDDLLVG